MEEEVEELALRLALTSDMDTLSIVGLGEPRDGRS